MYDEIFEDGFNDGVRRGRAEMLLEIMEHAAAFEAKMRKRRYFNNAAGVARFVQYLGEVVK